MPLASPPSAERPFVGRGRELAELRGALGEAQQGRGSCVLIAGEAGVGKTRLATELSGYAEAQGARVAWARCPEHGSAGAYRPWAQIFRTLIRAGIVSPGDPLLADVAESISELARFLPTPPTVRRLDPEQARFRLFDSTGALLEEVSSTQPLVLVFDDIHDADHGSLLLLHTIARELHRARLLLIGTYGDAVLRLRPTLDLITGDLARESRGILLRGLNIDDTELFIEQRTGARAARPLVDTIHRITEGNPFYLDEFVRLAHAQGRLQQTDAAALAALPIPDQVHGAIRRRLQPLSVVTQGVLSIAAVIGRNFDAGMLATLASSAAVTESLGEARRTGIIGVDADGSYAFAHAMIRECLYDDLDGDERAALHEQIGRRLASDVVADEDTPFVLAHHYSRACAPISATQESLQRAIAYTRYAGHAAAARFAFRDALQYFEASLSLLERDPAGDAALACDLLLDAGAASWGAGDVDGSAAIYRRAIAAARRLVADGHVDGPARFADAALGLAGRQQRSHVVFDPEIVDHLEEALARTGEEAIELRARLQARLAYALYSAPDSHERRESLCIESVTLARRSGDPETLISVLNDTRWARWGPDTTAARLGVTDELMLLASQTGDRERLIGEHAWRLIDLFELGDRNRAWAELRAYTSLATELRLPWYDWYVARFQALFAIVEGRFVDAEESIHAGLRAAQRVAHSDALLIFGVALLCLRRLQGRLDELEPELRSFATRYPRLSAWGCALAYTYAERGDLDRARVEFDRLAAADFTDLPRDYMHLTVLADLSEVCSALGDMQRAAILYDLLAPYADRFIVVGYGIAGLGSASRPLGLLAATLGRSEDAERHFADALAANERLGARPFSALTHFDWGRHLLTSDDGAERQRGHALIDAARQEAEQLGMAGLLRRIEIDATDPADRSHQSDVTLRREGDYWSLTRGARTVRIKHVRGLTYLATLLDNPGRPFHAADLAGIDRVNTTGDIGPLLDTEAKTAYRARIEALRERATEAEAANDFETAACARAEIQSIAEQIAQAVGLGGRDRPASSGAERVRIAVTKAIRIAERRIAEHDEEVARYLELTVRTGTFCEFTPAPGWLAFDTATKTSE